MGKRRENGVELINARNDYRIVGAAKSLALYAIPWASLLVNQGVVIKLDMPVGVGGDPDKAGLLEFDR